MLARRGECCVHDVSKSRFPGHLLSETFLSKFIWHMNDAHKGNIIFNNDAQDKNTWINRELWNAMILLVQNGWKLGEASMSWSPLVQCRWRQDNALTRFIKVYDQAWTVATIPRGAKTKMERSYPEDLSVSRRRHKNFVLTMVQRNRSLPSSELAICCIGNERNSSPKSLHRRHRLLHRDHQGFP